MKTPFIRPSAAAFAVIAAAISAEAAPFAQWFDDVQPDGTVIRIWGEGNDYTARFEAEDGHTIVYDSAERRYYYADRDEKTGALFSTGVPLGGETGHETEIKALRLHMRDTSSAARDAAKARAEKLDKDLGLTERWLEIQKGTEARREKLSRMKAAGEDGPLQTSVTAGNIVGVTFLIDFPITNSYGRVTNTTATVTGERSANGKEYMTGLLNGVGWSEDGNYSSVRDFYYEMSMGKLVYTNVVTDWIMAPKPRSHYDDPSRDNGDCARELIGDVFDVIAADADYSKKYLPLFKAATLTSGTSGSVMAFNVLFAGGSASKWSYGLWAHKWSLSQAQYDKLRWTAPDGSSKAYFWVYQITAVRSSSVDSAPVIGTICHEDGHMICGFPDYYHYSDDDNEGVGNWSLMCSGNHLDSGRSPAGIDAYSRIGVGWADPIDISLDQGWVSVTNDFACIYRYKRPGGTEYFLFENRQKTGLDRALYSGGIQIWRCRPGYSNTTATKAGASSQFAKLSTAAKAATNRWSGELSLEQADGFYGLERGLSEYTYGGGYRGSSVDPWYKGNRATAVPEISGSGYSGVWNDNTAACARWWDGTASGLKLSHFSENGGIMRFFVGEVSSSKTIVADVTLESRSDSGATFSAVVEAWGSGASSATVYAETATDPTFSKVSTTTKLGTISTLNKTSTWTVSSPSSDGAQFVRIKVSNTTGAIYGQTLMSLPAALDNTALTFTTGGDAPWFGQTDTTHDGVDAAQSGAIGDEQSSWLQTTVTGSGKISFWWNVSSESVNYDYLEFLVDGAQDSKIGGTSGSWAQKTVTISGSGSHTLKWNYLKDQSFSGGSDCCWVDQIVWTPDVSVPSAPASVSAADGASTANCTVSWGAVSGATSYTIYRATSASGTKTTLKSGVTAASYSDTSATPGTLYYYWVKAVNSAGASAFSASDTGYRKLATPSISSATGSTTGVALSWGTVTGASYYRVFRATSSSGTKTALGSWQTGTAYTDTTGTAGTTYYYFVQAAVNSSGTRPSAYSAAASAMKKILRPDNDDFASATALSGYSGSVSIDSTGATAQSGEPLHADMANNSAWWTWTAPALGTATFSTAGSAFDTVLAVYTGTAVGSLTQVAANDDAASDGTSRVVFDTAGAGTVYRIAVAGYDGAAGTVTLSWKFEAANAAKFTDCSVNPSAGTFHVAFKAKKGLTYKIQRCQTLGGSWTTVKTVTPSAAGTVEADVSTPTSWGSGFVRVVTEE